MYNIPRSSSSEIHKEGLLQRKNELDEGGRKVTTICLVCIMNNVSQAAVRSWKPYYAILQGNQLYFYKDKKDAQAVMITAIIL